MSKSLIIIWSFKFKTTLTCLNVIQMGGLWQHDFFFIIIFCESCSRSLSSTTQKDPIIISVEEHWSVKDGLWLLLNVCTGIIQLVIYSKSNIIQIGTFLRAILVVVCWLVHHFGPNGNVYWMACHEVFYRYLCCPVRSSSSILMDSIGIKLFCTKKKIIDFQQKLVFATNALYE